MLWGFRGREPLRPLLSQLGGDGFAWKCPVQSVLHSVLPRPSVALYAPPPSTSYCCLSPSSTWILECLCFVAGLTFSTQDAKTSGSQRTAESDLGSTTKRVLLVFVKALLNRVIRTYRAKLTFLSFKTCYNIVPSLKADLEKYFTTFTQF